MYVFNGFSESDWGNYGHIIFNEFNVKLIRKKESAPA